MWTGGVGLKYYNIQLSNCSVVWNISHLCVHVQWLNFYFGVLLFYMVQSERPELSHTSYNTAVELSENLV